jgi:DNA-binding NtrC family response regulator
MKGTELISKLREIQPKIACIMITGHPSIENAVKAVNEQADGYILKPFDVPKLLETVKIILKRKKDSYFQMFQEVERASKNTPIFKYQHPDKW